MVRTQRLPFVDPAAGSLNVPRVAGALLALAPERCAVDHAAPHVVSTALTRKYGGVTEPKSSSSEIVPHMAWTMDSAGNLESMTGRCKAALQHLANQSPISWVQLAHPEEREHIVSAWSASVRTGCPMRRYMQVLQPDGSYMPALVEVRPERKVDGQIWRWAATAISSLRHEGLPLLAAEGEAWMRQIIDGAAEAIQLLSLDGRILFVNKPSAEISAAMGWGNPTGELWVNYWPSARKAEVEALLALARKGETVSLDGVFQTVEGEDTWWRSTIRLVGTCGPAEPKLLVVSRDITTAKSAESRMIWAAQHDVLTGLPNRAMLQESLSSRVHKAERTGRAFALLILDLDNFKQINDTLGHDAGDVLLRECAQRLVKTVRPTDLVARLGGDEFAVLLSDAADTQMLREVGNTIIEALREPFTYSDRCIDSQTSIGASLWPVHGTAPSELLKSADIALYAAKEAGRGMLRVFEDSLRKDVQRRSSMMALAREAICERRIEPYYQPKLSLRTGEIVGFEALLRLSDHGEGTHTPDQIEAAFKDHRIAAALSDQMISRVVADILRWKDQGLPFRHVAINAAAAEFCSGNFAERLLEKLTSARLPFSSIQLEVTEAVFLGRGAEFVEQALNTLSREGVLIGLDDFGTGSASLAHLKHYPVDLIKIDRSFIRDFGSDPESSAIVSAILSLAQSLNIRAVAEGVETEAQHAALLARGCDYGQGFLYGQPRDVHSATVLLENDLPLWPKILM